MKNVYLLFLTLISLSIQANDDSKQFLSDTLKVTEKNVTYNVYENNTYLYLKISTLDKNTSLALLRSGLTVYFDIKGKEKKNVYIKYPYGTKPRKPLQKINDDNQKLIDLNKLIENIPNEAEYGYYDEIQQFHKDLNTQGISLNYAFNKDTLEFSLKIPKYRINNNEKVDFSKLSIGVKTNNPKGMIENTGNQNVRRGNRRASGSSRNRNGRQKGNRVKNIDTQKERITIDFWFDANLTNK